MQGEFRAAALRDQGRAVGVDEIVVPPPAGDDLLVEIVGAEDHLHQLADAPLAFQLDAGLLAHRAGAAVAAHEIAAAQLLRHAGSGARLHRHALVVLGEVLQPAAVAHGDVGRRLRHLLQERLQLVLRHQLIGLQQQGAVRSSRRSACGAPPPRDISAPRSADRRAGWSGTRPSGCRPDNPAPAPDRRCRCGDRTPWCARSTGPSSDRAAWSGCARSAGSARRAGQGRWPASGRPARRRQRSRHTQATAFRPPGWSVDCTTPDGRVMSKGACQA